MASLLSSFLLLLFFFPLCYGKSVKAKALFVFGDSYADTGNHDPLDPSVNQPWKHPYGLTWPGRPSGRFSNGHVLTDFFANHLGIKTPLQYRVLESKRKNSSKSVQAKVISQIAKSGINFAYGGSGVFPTFGPQYINISTQIEQLKNCIRIGLVSPELISKSSIALLVVAGNDYTAYGILHPNEEGLYAFIGKLVSEIATLIEMLYTIGFRRVAVTNLEPFGCFPAVTYLSNYTRCNKKTNGQSSFHNKLLASHIKKLQVKLSNIDIMTLDLEHAFENALQGIFRERKQQWRSCCEAINSGRCGALDTQQKPLFTLCSDPQKTFFWDGAHPTDFGWESVSKFLFPRS